MIMMRIPVGHDLNSGDNLDKDTDKDKDKVDDEDEDTCWS